MHAYNHVRTCKHIGVWVDGSIHVRKHSCIHAYAHKYMQTHIHTHIHTYDTYIHTCIHTYIMHTCMPTAHTCVCMMRTRLVSPIANLILLYETVTHDCTVCSRNEKQPWLFFPCAVMSSLSGLHPVPFPITAHDSPTSAVVTPRRIHPSKQLLRSADLRQEAITSAIATPRGKQVQSSQTSALLWCCIKR